MSSVVEVLPSSDDEEVYTCSSPQTKEQASASQPKEDEGTSTTAQTSAMPQVSETPAVNDVSDSATDDDEDAEHAVDLDKCLRLKTAGNARFGKGDVSGALRQYRRTIRCAPIKPHTKPSPPSDGDKAHAATDADPVSHAARGPESSVPSSTSVTADATPPAADCPPVESAVATAVESEDTTDYTLTSQVYCNAGLCLMKMRLFESAVDDLSEAIRHDGTYQKAFLRRAESYYELTKWSNAFADYDSYTKMGGQLDAGGRAKMADSKAKMEAEMQKMLGDLKEVGNKFLGLFGLSTDNFKFDKDPNSGGYSMRFER